MSAEPDLGRLPAGGLPDLLGPGISDLCWSGWDESTAAEPGMQSWDATAAATAAAEAATTHSADPELEKRRAQNRAAMQRHRQRQRQRQAEQQQQCAELVRGALPPLPPSLCWCFAVPQCSPPRSRSARSALLVPLLPAGQRAGARAAGAPGSVE